LISRETTAHSCAFLKMSRRFFSHDEPRNTGIASGARIAQLATGAAPNTYARFQAASQTTGQNRTRFGAVRESGLAGHSQLLWGSNDFMNTLDKVIPSPSSYAFVLLIRRVALSASTEQNLATHYLALKYLVFHQGPIGLSPRRSRQRLPSANAGLITVTITDDFAIRLYSLTSTLGRRKMWRR